MEILQKYDFPKDYDKSIVLIENEKAYIKPDAALRISKNLDGILPVLHRFKIIPGNMCNAVYDFVSHHRHKFYNHLKNYRNEGVHPFRNYQSTF